MSYNFLVRKPKRSWHKLSHEVKFDGGFGTLMPILCEEILPHDTVKLSTEVFTRFTALISPAFQRCDARLEYFFVPNRIIWDDWEKFIGGDDTLVKPYFNFADVKDKMVCNSVFDYLGFPVSFGTGAFAHEVDIHSGKVDAMPLRAYYKIWYDYYRDENIMTSAHEMRTDGGLQNASANSELLYLNTRCYPRDYFTSALPFAQDGGTPVSIPLRYPQGKSSMTASVANGDVEVNQYTVKAGGANTQFGIVQPQNIVQGPTIEELRRSSAVQRWLEKNIRFGNRYVEAIASHFGIRPSNYLLDRPEYLGGGKVNVRISEVLQTSESGSTPLGDDGGHAIASGSIRMKDFTAQEHGFLIALISYVPKASYGQGLPRKFNRWNYLDYAFPEFDNLGEQTLDNEEIYSYRDGNLNGVFGYKPRYDEYKHSYDRYCGQFRDTLNFWHLGRIFGSQPTLSPTFVGINYNPDIAPQTDPERLTRMFATDDSRNIQVDLYHHLYMKRTLSKSDTSLLK